MNRILQYFSGLTLLLASALPVAAAPDPAILGLWLTEKKGVLLDLYPCGEKVCGSVAWLAKPYRRSGEIRLDRHNPDPELRKRQWCGSEVIWDLSPKRGGSLDGGRFYYLARYLGPGGSRYRARLPCRELNQTRLVSSLNPVSAAPVLPAAHPPNAARISTMADFMTSELMVTSPSRGRSTSRMTNMTQTSTIENRKVRQFNFRPCRAERLPITKTATAATLKISILATMGIRLDTAAILRVCASKISVMPEVT